MTNQRPEYDEDFTWDMKMRKAMRTFRYIEEDIAELLPLLYGIKGMAIADEDTELATAVQKAADHADTARKCMVTAEDTLLHIKEEHRKCRITAQEVLTAIKEKKAEQ